MNARSNDQGLSAYVRKHFDFLIDDYDFQYHPKGVGYIKNDLELEFFHGKGEIEIVVYVRREDKIFRPYVSRLFDLLEIVRRLKPKGIQYPSDLPDYFIDMEDVDKYLEFCADLTKSWCKPILEGDMSVLEEIHLKRRKNA
jgi:hypothetical protein